MADHFKKFRVRINSRNSIEPEEIFFDGSKLREFEDSDINAGKLESPISAFALKIIIFIQIISLAALFGYTAFLSVFRGEDYARQAKANVSRTFPVYAPRGIIYSSDGVALVENEIYFDIIIKGPDVPSNDDEVKDISKKISDGLSLSKDTIFNKFKSAREWRYSELALKKGITREDISKIDGYIKDVDFIEIRESLRRSYPYGQYFSHVVGYTGEVAESDIAVSDFIPGERVGKMGAEAFYDSTLRGKTGVFIKKVDSRGRVLKSELTSPPEPGKDIILNINYELQKNVFDILKRHINALGLSAGAVIVLDSNSGAILSLVSMPSFDPNLFEIGISQEEFDKLIQNTLKPFLNRAISGEYPSGSIIKPIIAAAALEENVVNVDFLVYSDGILEVPSIYNPEVVYEFHDWKAHGWADIRKAISDSVNIYFYTIGGGYGDVGGLGIGRIEEYLSKFGWGKSLGIDLPGERSGLIPNPKWKKEAKGENWYIGDTYNVSIGQGDILATPLQISASTAVFANGGTLFSPKIVKTGEEKVKKYNLVSDENIDVVRDGMRRAAKIGSGKYLTTLSVETAGKTGTAQTGRGNNHAWFSGFAPYDDPEIVVTVLLEEGGKSDYAVHVARDIIQAYFDLK